MDLKNPLPKLVVICIFFNRLDTFYQAQGKIYLGGYSKDSIDKDRKIIVPIIEEIFKLLIAKKSGAKVLVASKPTP